MQGTHGYLGQPSEDSISQNMQLHALLHFHLSFRLYCCSMTRVCVKGLERVWLWTCVSVPVFTKYINWMADQFLL